MTYRIVRFFRNPNVDHEVLAEGVTLDEARKHCKDPESSSKTATSPEARKLTAERGEWFDGWQEE